MNENAVIVTTKTIAINVCKVIKKIRNIILKRKKSEDELIAEDKKKKENKEAIIAYIKDLGKNDNECELFSFISELEDQKYNQLHNILEQIYEIISERIAEKCKEYELSPEGKAEDAAYVVAKCLDDTSNGIKKITWKMKNHFGELEEFKFQANCIDSETWELMKMYADESYDSIEQDTFDFILDPVPEKLDVPFCDCGGYEVSDEFTIKGNMINSSCDTWGSQCGAKAESLFAFYITDLKKYAVVINYYWEM